jgi:hypothetical protein
MSVLASAAGCLAMSAAVSAAARNAPANRNRVGKIASTLYSPKCLEGVLSQKFSSRGDVARLK